MDYVNDLHKTLFSTQSPAARQYFESRKNECFLPDAGKIRAVVDATTNYCELDSEGSVILLGHQVILSSKSTPGCMEISRTEDLYQFSEIVQGSTTIFFVPQQNSRSFLGASLPLFLTLLRVRNISDQLLDFMCCFGLLNGERELSPPPVRFRWHNLDPPDACSVAFELTYIIRFVELNHRHEYNPWSLRQTLVFHGSSTSTTFIFVALSNAMKQTLGSRMHGGAQTRMGHPLEIHLVFIRAAAATWRSYLVYIAEESQQAEVAELEDDGIYGLERDQRQRLHELETWVTDIATAVKSSLDLCSTLRLKNAGLEQRRENGPTVAPNSKMAQVFLDGLDETQRDFEHYRQQAELMHVKIHSTATLLTNILDLDNGHALRILALEARQENVAMQKLTEKGAKDAEAVKVLTIVALVFLPTTAVLNFFSTSFVDSSSQPNGSQRLRIASNWWVSVAVAVPLTTVTLYIWWCYVQAVVYNKPPLWLRTLSQCVYRLPRLQRRTTRVLGSVDSEMTGGNVRQYSRTQL